MESVSVNINTQPVVVTVNVTAPSNLPRGGAAGQSLIKSGSDDFAFAWQNVQPSVSFGTLYRSGRFFSIPFTNVNFGIGFTANNIKAYPFIVPIDITLASIRIKISSGRTNAKACLGIYADNGNFYPGDILVNAGEVDCSTSGTKTISFSKNITKDVKLVWLAVNINDGSVGYLYITGGLNIIGNSAPNCMYNAPCDYTSALPTTFPANATENQGPIDGILVEVGIA